VFALFLALIAAAVARKRAYADRTPSIRLLASFFIIASSHALLDCMTSGGLGSGLFIPFENRRIFFPWRPIAVAPVDIGAFWGPWGLRIVRSELVYVGIPALLLAIASFAHRRVRERGAD
jgi:inner membrane protein